MSGLCGEFKGCLVQRELELEGDGALRQSVARKSPSPDARKSPSQDADGGLGSLCGGGALGKSFEEGRIVAVLGGPNGSARGVARGEDV